VADHRFRYIPRSMTVSPRWSFAIGLVAAGLSAALAALGASYGDSDPPASVPPSPLSALRPTPLPGGVAGSASAADPGRPGAGGSSSQAAAITSAGATSGTSLALPGAPAAKSSRITSTSAPGVSSLGPQSLAASTPVGSPGLATLRRQTSLESVVRPLLDEPRLRAGVFGVDLRSGAYFNLLGDRPYSAASLIKVPIVVALLTQVERGAISLDELLDLRADQIAGGSGSIQYLPIGTRFSVRRLAEVMIRRSDNTATNMLVDRLGGFATANATFSAWGLSQTVMRAPLPDLEGTNSTSPQDLVTILGRAVTGGLLRPDLREMLLSWMRRTHVRSLLPSGTGRGSLVANKTGDIPGATVDAGYVEAPDGHCYLLAVQVERPRNNGRAKELIRRVSRVVYRSITGLAPGDQGPVGRGRSASRRASPSRLSRRA